MKAVRANADGSVISWTTSVGVLPAAIVPVTTRGPGVGSVTSRAVVPLASTVVARVSTVYAAVSGRQSIVVASPAAGPGVTSMSMRFSLTQIGEMRPSG